MTPTLHPTEAGLLRAICEKPADDDVRLILADWYEENGQEERGAFVRIQCALAKHEAAISQRGTGFPPPPMPEGFLSSREVKALGRREREIVEKYGEAWVVELLASAKISGADGSS